MATIFRAVNGTSAQRGPVSRTIESDGCRVHCLDYGGTGKDLLLIPGITMPAATWGFVSEELAAHFRVLSVDLPGRGLSQPGRPGRHCARAYARDLLEIVRDAGMTRPILLGHSLGARVVAAFAVDHPGVAGHVVLADPPLCGPGQPPYATPLESFLADIAAARRPDGLAHVRAKHPGWTDEQVAARAKWLPTCDEAAIAEDYANFGAEDFFGMWRRVRPPATLVYGAASPMYTSDAVERLRQENPAVHVVGLDGAGHMLPFDDLEGFLAVIVPLRPAQTTAVRRGRRCP